MVKGRLKPLSTGKDHAAAGSIMTDFPVVASLLLQQVISRLSSSVICLAGS